MVDNVANSALTTGPRTGILAFVPETCFIARTLQVEDTFRAAGFVGVAQVFRKTLALAIPAESVGATWRWTARITDRWYSGCGRINIIVSSFPVDDSQETQLLRQAQVV